MKSAIIVVLVAALAFAAYYGGRVRYPTESAMPVSGKKYDVIFFPRQCAEGTTHNCSQPVGFLTETTDSAAELAVSSELIIWLDQGSRIPAGDAAILVAVKPGMMRLMKPEHMRAFLYQRDGRTWRYAGSPAFEQ